MASEPKIDLREVERDCEHWIATNPAGSLFHQHARSVKRIIAALRGLQYAYALRSGQSADRLNQPAYLRLFGLTDSAPQEQAKEVP